MLGPMAEPQLVLAEIAGIQHGVFTARQALEQGLSRNSLRAMVTSGWCERLALGLYRVRAAPHTVQQRISTAVLSAGPKAVASRRSALYLWGAPVEVPQRPEVLLPRDRSSSSVLADVQRTNWLPAQHTTVKDGIAVTSPARTIFDLAGSRSRRQLLRDADDLLHREVCTIDELRRVADFVAGRGRPGSQAMADLLAEMTEGYIPSASELEQEFRDLLAANGIEIPRFEANLGAEEWIGRVDAYWDWAALVVELDGRKYHGGLMARDSDRRRDNELMAGGVRVLRFTWRDLKERPGWVLSVLLAALSAHL